MSSDVKWRPAPDGDAKVASLAERYFSASLGPRMEGAARSLVPIDTGELRSTIRHRTGTDSEGAFLILSAGGPSRGSYAIFVELGTSRMRAQPFIQPAAFRRW